MNIPAEAIISDDKLTRYLLVYKARNDKSKFLARAGFTLQNPENLLAAIRSLSEAVEAVEDRTDEYGTFYRVEGELIGVNGVHLSVTTVWLRRKIDGQYQFVTLKPRRE